MASIPTPAVNLTKQLIAITGLLPNSVGTVRGGELRCTLQLQPSPASHVYTVRLVYRHGRRPQVTITEPPLTLHPGAARLPHVHIDDELCLYYGGEWKHSMLIATTIVPWAAEWLMHYELWLITGTWSGGGTVHGVLP